MLATNDKYKQKIRAKLKKKVFDLVKVFRNEQSIQ